MMNLKVQVIKEISLSSYNEPINEVLQKVSKNCKLTHHEIQKDIVNAIA